MIDGKQDIARCTLYWLMAALLMVVVPHVGRLPLLVTAFFLTLLSWRYMITVYGWRALSRPSRIALTFLALAIVYISHGTLLGRDAGIALLVAMLGIKLLEMFTRRDVYITMLIGYFLVITHFLYTQSMVTAVYMFGVVIVITAALVDLNRHNHGAMKGVWANLRLASGLLLQAVPFMLLLFVLFPRIGAPLWGLPSGSEGGMTGLDVEMTPGQISHLSQSDAIAFRVEFKGNAPSQEVLYWRGPVFTFTDGRRWRPLQDSRVRAFNAPSDILEPKGEPVRYTVTLEPHNRQWLYALDIPDSSPYDASMTNDYQLHASRNVTSRVQYEVMSYVDYRMRDLDPNARYWSLMLPPDANPRTRALGEKWRKELGIPFLIINKALQMFREQPFVYTLRPPMLLSPDPTDEFLFETQRGFCEHYSSSFVTLMRAAGIPARVVTGYQGGERNPMGNYLIVRQRDAHAWAEVWLEERGWVRIDPTAAVAPERIERPIDNAFAEEGEAVRFQLDEESLLYSVVSSFRYGWDNVNHGWNKWVLNYNEARQRDFLRGLGIGIDSWRDMVGFLTLGMGLLLAGFGVFLLKRDKEHADPVVMLWKQYCGKLARRGFYRTPSEGPRDFTQRVARARPDLRPQLERIADLYIKLRYANRCDLAVLETLRREVRTIKP